MQAIISMKTVLATFLLCLAIFRASHSVNATPASPKKEASNLDGDSWSAKKEMNNLIQLLANAYKDQSGEELNREQVPLIKKFDDYGHLRFGRSDPNRFKYSDPDYGHMRFGK